MTHDTRVTALFLAAGAPAVAIACITLWRTPLPLYLRLAAVVIVAAIWVGLSMVAREQLVRPLQTVANLLAALREGDFSIRARSGAADDALGHVMIEINTLAETRLTSKPCTLHPRRSCTRDVECREPSSPPEPSGPRTLLRKAIPARA